ncbi:MMPL family transporter [Pseudomonas sp. GV071]|uniref:MMPL family transporter n=1 Tax=Pseudomonas sp. GV071 TaxID=2135754 RepID=UPI000D399EE2|nr:MMPL family transporter [Pseudomonas sp. GV071]PTQ68656.1 putative exporter [Pseudomonas sp. GV071]
MLSRIEHWGPRLFTVALVALLALTAWQWRAGAPVSANLLELVPSDTPDPLEQRAEKIIAEPLNRELVLLISFPDRQKALRQAAAIGQQWQQEKLVETPVFEKVQWDVNYDLNQLRQQLLDSRLALLGSADRQLLQQDPRAFVERRVQDLFDPFHSQGLLSTEQDWLGLGARIEKSLPHFHNVQVDLSGALLAESDGKTWALLRARTTGDAFDGNLPLTVENLVANARADIEAQGGELLASSGLLYSAHGQRQATSEISFMGSISSVGALLLMLVAFRRMRVLLALLPAAIGVLAGLTATVAVFGNIHVLTLVLGASLIGVAIDYPLHLLSKSWTLQPWNSWQALRATFLGLSLGLATNVIGYLALAFTPFPALSQVAIFSSAGLLGSYLCAVCLLPALLGKVQIVPWRKPYGLAERLLDWRRRMLLRIGTPWLLLIFLLFCAAGVLQLKHKDDLRQWASTPPALLQQSMAISTIIGFQPTSQFYLVRGKDEEQLLQRQQVLSQRLDQLIADGKLKSYLALSQLVAPVSEQASLRDSLGRVPAVSDALQALGVTAAQVQDEVRQLQALPNRNIEQSLAGTLGEPWRNLWLGSAADGQVAGLVSLQGLSDTELLAAQAEGLPGVKLVDRLGQLNRLFAATQISAAELKLASCLLIFALLCLPFGPRGAARVLAVSLLAALASLASLGWLGQPLTLFSLFGLLLVTAIGVDYAIIMRERVGGAATSLLGTLLSALTTWLSFGLLALSSTPAVSNFGLTISIGLTFSFLLSPWAGEQDSHSDKEHRA